MTGEQRTPPPNDLETLAKIEQLLSELDAKISKAENQLTTWANEREYGFTKLSTIDAQRQREWSNQLLITTLIDTLSQCLTLWQLIEKYRTTFIQPDFAQKMSDKILRANTQLKFIYFLVDYALNPQSQLYADSIAATIEKIKDKHQPLHFTQLEEMIHTFLSKANLPPRSPFFSAIVKLDKRDSQNQPIPVENISFFHPYNAAYKLYKDTHTQELTHQDFLIKILFQLDQALALLTFFETDDEFRTERLNLETVWRYLYEFITRKEWTKEDLLEYLAKKFNKIGLKKAGQLMDRYLFSALPPEPSPPAS